MKQWAEVVTSLKLECCREIQIILTSLTKTVEKATDLSLQNNTELEMVATDMKDIKPP